MPDPGCQAPTCQRVVNDSARNKTSDVSAHLACCPICDSESPPLYQISGHGYHRCPACTHQFLDYTPPATHIVDQYSDDYFSGEGDGYSDYLSERDLLIRRGEKYAKEFAKLTGKSSGKLLDVGSAAGFLARGFQQQGWSAQGLEPSPTMTAHASDNEGVPTTCGSLEQFETEERLDLILLVQVIAHLGDPATPLRKIRSLLKPGGHLLIETWDSQSLVARTLKKNWHEYNPPSVLHAFTKKSLQQLAEQQGFASVASRRITKSIKAGHGKSLLAHKYGNSLLYRLIAKPALCLLPDRLTLPYPADDLFWTVLRAPE